MAEPTPPTNPSPADPEFRWTAFFQRSSEAIFVLNRRRQILFANHAWEKLTGCTAREAHKQVCKRQRDAEPGSMDALLSALHPPREAMEGRHTQVRRLVALNDAIPQWWDLEFFPLIGP